MVVVTDNLQRLRRGLAPVRELPGNIILLAVVGIVKRIVQVGMILALAHARLVDGDLDQPGAELSLGAKLVKMGKRLHDSFLGYILGVRLVAQKRQSRSVNAALVGLNQFSECVAVALKRTANQGRLTLILRRRNCARSCAQ